MTNPITDYVGKALLPRTILKIDHIKMKNRMVPTLERALGLVGKVELYFAFDDPYAAIAVPKIFKMLTNRDVEPAFYPIVRRGIENDPDLDKRRAYAMEDARRLAASLGMEIIRKEAPTSEETAFVAAWAEAGREDGDEYFFIEKALSYIWKSNDAINRENITEVYLDAFDQDPPDDFSVYEARVRKNEKRLVKKGHWESPAALVYGQWYFAHERLDQIAERLDYLGRRAWK